MLTLVFQQIARFYIVIMFCLFLYFFSRLHQLIMFPLTDQIIQFIPVMRSLSICFVQFHCAGYLFCVWKMYEECSGIIRTYYDMSLVCE